MSLIEKVKRLREIVWQDGGLSWLWAGISMLPAAIDFANTRWPSQTQQVTKILDVIEWWWSLPIFTIWVIVALARQIFAYETPALEMSVYRDVRQPNSWWIELRNAGTKTLKNCAVDFEKIENEAGVRIFPQSFGLTRASGISNPFPLRAGQPKQGQFANLVSNKITIFGTTVDRQDTVIELEDDKYSVTVGAYSEIDGAHCRKVLVLQKENGSLLVSS